MDHSDNRPATGAVAPEVARQRLEAERRDIAEEIRNYPGPIAGCDQQFNHLLERRKAVVRALAALPLDGHPHS